MDEAFYGSATVGDRGQLVIPAEAREHLGIAPGDKLLVMKHPIHEGIMLFKIESAREFVAEFKASMDRMLAQVSEGEGTEGEEKA